MGISRLSDRFGFYNPLSKPRLRQEGPAVSGTHKVNAVPDQRQAPIKTDEPSRLSPSRPQPSPLSDTAQHQQYKLVESVHTDNLCRDSGISRHNLFAINAYQHTENQEKRDQIEKMLGFDLYV